MFYRSCSVFPPAKAYCQGVGEKLSGCQKLSCLTEVITLRSYHPPKFSGSPGGGVQEPGGHSVGTNFDLWGFTALQILGLHGAANFRLCRGGFFLVLGLCKNLVADSGFLFSREGCGCQTPGSAAQVPKQSKWLTLHRKVSKTGDLLTTVKTKTSSRNHALVLTKGDHGRLANWFTVFFALCTLPS